MVTFSLDQVVRELMIEAGHSNENQYARYLQHGISGLREFNFDLDANNNGSPTCVYLPINDNLTVDLPADYINYVRIATIDANGQIHSLGLNNNMAFNNAVNACGDPIGAPTPSTTSGNQADAFLFGGTWDGYADNWRNGELMGRMFGIGGGTNASGYYRIDRAKGQIQLGAIHQTTLFLEYLSDLSLIDGEYFVHPYAVEALKCYIYWKTNLRNARQSGNVKQEARQEYFNEFFRAKARFNSMTTQEWIDGFRGQNKAAPKF